MMETLLAGRVTLFEGHNCFCIKKPSQTILKYTGGKNELNVNFVLDRSDFVGSTPAESDQVFIFELGIAI